MKLFLQSCVVALTLFACSGNQTKEKVESDAAQKENRKQQEINYVRQTAEISKAAQKVLKQNLLKAISEKGLPGAIEFCSVKASQLSDSVGKLNNVEISRVSHRYRNPSNKADDYEIKLINEYQRKLKNTGNLGIKSRKTGNQVIAYSPIVLNKGLCLNCHGEAGKEINEKTLAAIDKTYPNDKARGFEMGDLRGMWKIAYEKK